MQRQQVLKKVVEYSLELGKPIPLGKALHDLFDRGSLGEPPPGVDTDAYLEDLESKALKAYKDYTSSIETEEMAEIKINSLNIIRPATYAWPTEPREAKRRAKVSKVEYELLQKLFDDLDEYEFQDFCSKWLEKCGCTATSIRPRGPDGGIDFEGYIETAFALIRVIGQAKKFQRGNVVGRPTVDELCGRLITCPKDTREDYSLLPVMRVGVIVTTSTFSTPARDAASEAAIRLFDGKKLARDLVSRGIGIQWLNENSAQLDSRPPLDWFESPSDRA